LKLKKKASLTDRLARL